ncbi:MAG: glycogen debranching protein GlgX [Kaiparowitsia implicata GSE-PSE-MK54-09C]|jgi:glycogen operon protein|nr:glycogen debranching protein GlgX [Kaiparowitsia implicata GSE-PSE-MK54-09C]
MTANILPGLSYPLGATVLQTGVNFCIASKDAEAIDLLLFDGPEDPKPARVICLDPKLNKTAYYWHVLVPDVGEGQVYAYRAHGKYWPEAGFRFDASKVLLDPYAHAVVGWQNYDRQAAGLLEYDNCATALRAVVVAPSTQVVQGMKPGSYDWEGDRPLGTALASSVIYEMHVGGFTRNPNSGVAPHKRGTYAGVIEKIPYLKQLGITAVELLPIHEFDEDDAPPDRKNYWGYSTLSFFSPHRAYSSCKDPLGPVREFRDMVKALHQAGIEVILDVVFNHTAEGSDTGPTLSYRGLWNDAYYMLETNKTFYSNYSGCGNTVNANHPVTRNLVIDSLRYWVAEMHVDGFRFDLASALSRDHSGRVLERPPVLWSIEADPILAKAKIIAEAWDAGGLYQVGSFVGDRFAEWNGPYRDDMRRFIKSEPNTIGTAAQRILGSPDIFSHPERDPNRSINFVTCHDGFTMNDLVSYNEKHNLANGEANRDGGNHNHSWNCGVEGPTDDPEIEALRLKQIKNFFTVLFLSQGTPMILMGDEVRRTQQGNNNAYCQDNELSWFDWSRVESQAELLRFVQMLISKSKSLALMEREELLDVEPDSRQPNIVWHGTKRHKPDWGSKSHALAFELNHPAAQEHLYVIINAYWELLPFELPPLMHTDHQWRRIVDTSLPSPDDFCELDTAPIVTDGIYRVPGRSSVILYRK